VTSRLMETRQLPMRNAVPAHSTLALQTLSHVGNVDWVGPPECGNTRAPTRAWHSPCATLGRRWPSTQRGQDKDDQVNSCSWAQP
jgi:hypothetical protein